MSRRTRGTVIGLAIVAGLVIAEVVLHWVRGPEALVEIENMGTDPIGSLVVTLGTSRVALARVDPGATAKVYLGGRGPQTLRLSFRQTGNAMTGYQFSGFDPEQMRRDGFKLVLKVRPNEVVRFQDDAGPATPMGQAVRDLRDWFLKELGVEPDDPQKLRNGLRY